MARLRRITISGNRSIEYVSQGEGPATLLVHPGGPGFTYHYLRPLLRLANAHLRVVLFHPRGVGNSWKPKRPSAYTIPNLAGDVESIRRALDITELHLLGYSAGGWVALEYAHRYPKKLTSLLLCATCGSAEELRASNRLMVASSSPSQRKKLKNFEATGDFRSKAYQALVEEITRPFQSRFLKGVPKDLKASKLSPEVYRAMMTRTGNEFVVDGTIARWDGRRYYSKIEVPTVVVVGLYDYFLTASREMADRIEPAHLRVLPASSHMEVLEQPREFLNTIRDFLVDVTGD